MTKLAEDCRGRGVSSPSIRIATAGPHCRQDERRVEDCAAEARRLLRDGHEPVLKQTRWYALKRQGHLLRYNLQTVRASLLTDEFQQLWEYEAVGETCSGL